MRKVLVEKKITYQGVEVPGGWFAWVPEESFAGDADALNTYARHFMREGAKPLQAQELAKEVLRRSWEGSFITRLRMAIGRWAKEYEARFGSLEGFDPEVMQEAYVPFGDFYGRRGKPYVGEIFRRMRAEASDE